MIHDLRQWLSRVEELGELVCVDQPLDPIEEMGAVTYLVAKQTPSPAVLFERPKGFESSPLGARLLWNILGPSMRRTALTLEEPAETPTLELIQRVKDKMQVRLPPEEVSERDAPVFEHSLQGDEIDLTSLPFPKHWPLDGGRYAGTADAVITRDPDSGYLNVGTYRMMIHGPRQCGLYLSPGKDARLHIPRAWQRPTVHGGRLADVPQEPVGVRLRGRYQRSADPGRARQGDGPAPAGQRRICRRG